MPKSVDGATGKEKEEEEENFFSTYWRLHGDPRILTGLEKGYSESNRVYSLFSHFFVSVVVVVVVVVVWDAVAVFVVVVRVVVDVVVVLFPF